MTVAKEGTLRDYYDIEAVMDVYDENGITYNDAIVGMMADVPLIFLLTRKYTDYDNRVYDPYFDMEDDANDVLKTYKAAGMIIAGLLFGYPLEATISEIHKFEHLWF